MKKVLLTAMALLTIAASSAFGMYGNDKSWIDFLVHANQFRARMDQFGFVLGNDTIRGTFGFKGATGGLIMHAVSGKDNKDNNLAVLSPTISMGIGYTSPAFGIGVGYNYTFKSKDFGVHTPVVALTALNNNLRIVVPVQIGIANNSDGKDTYFTQEDSSGILYTAKDYVSMSVNPEIRYYTGIDALSHIRLTLRYGMASYKASYTADATGITTDDRLNSSFGFEFRVDFLKTLVGNVEVAPFFRVKFNTALEGTEKGVTAGYYNIAKSAVKSTKDDINKPYDVTFELPFGLGASTDILSLYLEPSIGYSFAGSYGGKVADKTIQHKLAWGAYGEIYLKPVQDLEWYFEANVGSAPKIDTLAANPSVPYTINGNQVYFETSTGITWYLPTL